MFTSLSAAVQYVQTNKLKPFYLLTEDAKKDFAEQTTGKNMTATDGENDENTVVVGLAPDKFIYETMNAAFRYVWHLSYSNKRFFYSSFSFRLFFERDELAWLIVNNFPASHRYSYIIIIRYIAVKYDSTIKLLAKTISCLTLGCYISMMVLESLEQFEFEFSDHPKTTLFISPPFPPLKETWANI